MTTRKAFEDKETVVYEHEDTEGLALGLLATHQKEYEAKDKQTGAEAKGDSVAEATNNLREGQSKSDDQKTPSS
jgi:hypothetical protein